VFARSVPNALWPMHYNLNYKPSIHGSAIRDDCKENELENLLGDRLLLWTGPSLCSRHLWDLSGYKVRLCAVLVSGLKSFQCFSLLQYIALPIKMYIFDQKDTFRPASSDITSRLHHATLYPVQSSFKRLIYRMQARCSFW